MTIQQKYGPRAQPANSDVPLDSLVMPTFTTPESRQVERRVMSVVSTLDELKQLVVRRRFGFIGEPESYEQTALNLSSQLSPELRIRLAERQGVAPDQLSFDAQQIRRIEAEAFRQLRSGMPNLTLAL